MRIINPVCCLMIIVAIITTASAQYRTAGSTSFQNLLLNYDARSVGLAGASVAMPGGLGGSIQNPAVLAGLERPQGFVGYQLVLDGVWGAPLGYARPVSGAGVVSIMFQGLSSGNVDVIGIGPDEEPVYTGETAHDEYFTPGISFARSFFESRLYAGVTIKGLYHRIAVPSQVYSSKAVAADIGIQYRVMGERLIVAAVLRNAGVEFSPFEEDERYSLPMLFEAGISYVPRYISAMRIAADINKIRGDYVNFEPGIEFEVYPDILFARIGYVFSGEDLSEMFNQFSDDEGDDYVKSNWSTLALGIGVYNKFSRFALQVDFGLQLRTSWIAPSPVIAVAVDF